MSYLVTRHTMLGPGEMPPRAKEDLDEPDLAKNTRINHGSTNRAF
ncbi:hypothetical protein ACWEV9_35035 [Streptomyces albogriseolus]